MAAALAGCAGHLFLQRDPWRKEAELACLKTGAVKESGTLVRIEPINGPGLCGAEFPFKVAALGDSSLLGYSSELRPPADVPGSRRWPLAAEPRQATSAAAVDGYYANPMRAPRVERQPLYEPRNSPPLAPGPVGAPMQIHPPADRYAVPAVRETHSDQARGAIAPARRPSVFDPPSDPTIDEEDEENAPARIPSRAAPYPPQPQRPSLRSSPPQATPVAFGRNAIAAVGAVEIKPAATLACPIISALDRWIVDAVQPAAQRWFRQPVVEIRQISAYSCRGMNGQPGARISEHAFGNALDIAAFVLSDGRRITVKNGWRGSPEEQGFLRDVQGAACDQFNTVLAPGSNRFHYDHFHVDLMRRASGHRICNPDSIPGEVVAARVAKERGYAWRPDPGVTGSIGKNAGKTRSVSLKGKPKPKGKLRNILSPDDDDWIEDDGPRLED